MTLSVGTIVRRACRWFAGGAPTREAAVPRLVFYDNLSVADKEKVDLLIHKLSPHADYKKGGRLWAISSIALASWLLHLSKFIANHSSGHICVQKFQELTQHCTIPMSTIHLWAKAVEDDFMGKLYMAKEEIITTEVITRALRNLEGRHTQLQVYNTPMCIYYIPQRLYYNPNLGIFADGTHGRGHVVTRGIS